MADHNVQFGSLHLGDVLFSPNHGLLSATPLVYLAVLGLPLFFRRDRAFAAVLVLGLVAQVYVNSAVDVWWGGAGFGARRFSSCALAFAVGLACLLDWMRRRPLVAPAAIGSALVFVNVVFMLDVRHGRLPASEGVSFNRLLDSVYERVGNPFSFPLNAIVAWKYDVGMPVYDQLLGRTYNNVTIDLGEADDVRFLGPGWLSREQGPGFSFRWATGDESVVVAPLMASDDYRLELQCGPFAYPEMPAPQAVEVFWNGHEAGTIALDRGLSNYTLQVPEAFVTPKLNQIRFRYRESTSPAAVGLSADARQLSMQCDWIRLTRLLND